MIPTTFIGAVPSVGSWVHQLTSYKHKCMDLFDLNFMQYVNYIDCLKPSERPIQPKKKIEKIF